MNSNYSFYNENNNNINISSELSDYFDCCVGSEYKGPSPHEYLEPKKNSFLGIQLSNTSSGSGHETSDFIKSVFDENVDLIGN